MFRSDPGVLGASVSNSVPGSTQDYIKVHTVDTNAGVVFDTQIDMFVNTETEVALLGETPLPQLVLLDLEASLEDLLSFGTTHCAPTRDLLVTSDTKGSDSEASFGEAGFLAGQLFQDFSSACQSITGLSYTDVQAQLCDTDIFHGVLLFGRHGYKQKV